MTQRTRVKICGCRLPQDIEAAVDAGADLIGFVFVQDSPRYLSPDQARLLIHEVPAGIETVGLFSNHSLEDVLQAAATAGCRTIQLHGREGPGTARRLGEAGLKVIKAVGFDHDHLTNRLQPWNQKPGLLHGLLVDSPPTEQQAGGRGETFDWTGLKTLIDQGTFQGLPPMLLAGGLTPENVGQAIQTVRPYAVDVSSGVESSRGVKDPAEIMAFCRAVQTADAAH